MNTGLLVSLMFACGFLIGWFPFLCFMIAQIALGIQGMPFNLLLMALLITVVGTFLLSAAAFTYLQYNSCKKVKNVKQIFANAGLAAGLQFITLLFVHFTGLTSVPINMLPLSLLNQFGVKEGVGYGYYSFFAATFGIIFGGTLSSVC
jgi:hypothetical protein